LIRKTQNLASFKSTAVYFLRSRPPIFRNGQQQLEEWQQGGSGGGGGGGEQEGACYTVWRMVHRQKCDASELKCGSVEVNFGKR
jgi:hypothetical protein